MTCIDCENMRVTIPLKTDPKATLNYLKSTAHCRCGLLTYDNSTKEKVYKIGKSRGGGLKSDYKEWENKEGCIGFKPSKEDI